MKTSKNTSASSGTGKAGLNSKTTKQKPETKKLVGRFDEDDDEFDLGVDDELQGLDDLDLDDEDY